MKIKNLSLSFFTVILLLFLIEISLRITGSGPRIIHDFSLNEPITNLKYGSPVPDAVLTMLRYDFTPGKNVLGHFEKYDPPLSIYGKIIGMIQFIFSIRIALSIFLTLPRKTYTEIAIFAIIIIGSTTISTMFLQNIKGPS